jgi:hypothetical protein
MPRQSRHREEANQAIGSSHRGQFVISNGRTLGDEKAGRSASNAEPGSDSPAS